MTGAACLLEAEQERFGRISSQQIFRVKFALIFGCVSPSVPFVACSFLTSSFLSNFCLLYIPQSADFRCLGHIEKFHGYFF